MHIVNRNKFVIFFIIILSMFNLNVFALKNISKADFPNIPNQYIDQLATSDLSIENLKTVNQQIIEYKLTDKEISDYIKKITTNGEGGAYPQDKNGNTLTPYGIIPKTSSVWQDEIDSQTHKVGAIIGNFKNTAKSLECYNTKNNKTTYIPLYSIDGDEQNYYYCFEDLTNCGYAHNWDTDIRTTTMQYTGKYTGLSKQSNNVGNVYYSDIKTIIVDGRDEYEVKSYNIGGYSLANIVSLDGILQVKIVDKNKSEQVNNDVVSVKIPAFKVTLNGEIMDNKYNEYPLLLYKHITYFPMTYDGARFLGLKVNWYQNSKIYDNKAVLFVGVCPKDELKNKLEIIKSQSENGTMYSATIADYGLALNTVNPKQFINNVSEEYPILNFRGISYFPLTWKYAVDEFGWTYSYTNQDGLKINSGNALKPVIDDTVIQ